MYFCKYAKSKEKVLFYSYSSLFLEYRLKIQSIGVSNGLCCIFYLTVSSYLKYAYFYRRFQSFQSLFGSLFSLISLAVWIYFNRLQTTAALELNYFLFETFNLLPFFGIRESLSRAFDNCCSLFFKYLCSFRSNLQNSYRNIKTIARFRLASVHPLHACLQGTYLWP